MGCDVMSEKRYRSTFYLEGKRYETTGKNQKEADQKAAIKMDKLKRGEVGISGDMTVARWAAQWLATYKKPKVGEGQYKNYLLYVNKIIVPAIGTLKVKHVKDIHLQKILNERIGKSKSDLTKLRMTMKAIFKRALISKLITYNPAENLEMPAAKDGTHRSITDHERKKILEVSDIHHAGLWIKMMLYCGLRPGETRALDWRHVDIERKLIHIELAMKAATKEIRGPKSDAGVRDVPIPLTFFPDLQKARQGPFDPVFVQPTTGRRHTKQSMRCLWNNFKRELDISMGAKLYRNEIVLSVVASDLTAYCLRHTYCTDLQDVGVPINVARYLMGHEDISTTSRIYTDTTERAIQDAAEKINKPKAELEKVNGQ